MNSSLQRLPKEKDSSFHDQFNRPQSREDPTFVTQTGAAWGSRPTTAGSTATWGTSDTQDAELRQQLTDLQSQLQNIASDQDRRRDELEQYIDDLQITQTEEGDPLVDFPSNYNDIIAQLSSDRHSLASEGSSIADLPGPDDDEVDPRIAEGLEQIRKHDRILAKKVKRTREVRKQLHDLQAQAREEEGLAHPDLAPPDIDEVKTKKPSSTPKSTKTKATSSSTSKSRYDFVNRNIELAPSGQDGKFFSKLLPEEEERIDAIMEGGASMEAQSVLQENYAAPEDAGMLASIERKLQDMRPMETEGEVVVLDSQRSIKTMFSEGRLSTAELDEMASQGLVGEKMGKSRLRMINAELDFMGENPVASEERSIRPLSKEEIAALIAEAESEEQM